MTYLFLQWEEDQWFYRWERMLGLVWTPQDLEVLSKQASKKEGSSTEESAPSVAEEPSVLRYPLSLLVRPELLTTLQERAIPGGGGLFGMGHVPTDAQSLYGSSKEDFLRRMGATAAAGHRGDDFDSQGPRDPYAQNKPKGFSEGPQRAFGGRRK